DAPGGASRRRAGVEDVQFAFTDDQLAFRDAVRDALAASCDRAGLRAASESAQGRTAKAWAALADMGVLDALRAERDGGLGLGEVDVIAVLEETGRCALPEPIVDTLLVGVPLGVVDAPTSVSVVAPESPLGVWTDTADAVVTLAADGMRVYPRADVVLHARPSVDPARRLFEIDAGSERPPDRPLGDVVLAFRRMVLGTAAQLCGLADTMITMTVEYAADRHQFGVPIGSFQAVKHHLADARTILEFARPLVYRAAASMAIRDRDAGLHVGMAKAATSDAASVAARAALQCHGAIGYTTEHDLHLFMKRAWALSAAWGDARWHRARIADTLMAPEGTRA
ncbi:MAG TPA: acyl-CoA dehydrogenase, partial [Acidimicrobiia bacterium]